MGQCSDFSVPEGCDAVSSHRLRHLVRPFGVLEGLARMLVSAEVVVFSMLLGDTMGVRRTVVKFGGTLVVLVMRSVVMARRHI